MLKEIRINNFRNLKDVKINPSLITLLIGLNDSGKSGIFHSLLVLKQTFHTDFRPSNLIFVGNFINLGSEKEVVYQHDPNNAIEIGLTKDFDLGFKEGNVNSSKGELNYTATSKEFESSCTFQMKLGNLEGKYDAKHNSNTVKVTIDGNEILFDILNPGSLGFNGRFQDEQLKKYNEIFGTTFLRRILEENLFIIPVPRGIGEFKTELLKIKPTELTTSRGTAELTKNLLSLISYDLTLTDKISKYMERLFGKKIRYQPIPVDLGEIDVTGGTPIETFGTVDFHNPDIRSYASNTGFGLNQSLFLFAQILNCPNGSTILIEEPEISLHPSAQRKLMKILVEIAKEQNKQLIISTHSEHIAFALFDSIDKGDLNVNNLAIYNFKKQKDLAEIKKVDTLEGSLIEFLGNDPKLIQQYMQALGKTSQYLETGTFS